LADIRLAKFARTIENSAKLWLNAQNLQINYVWRTQTAPSASNWCMLHPW